MTEPRSTKLTIDKQVAQQWRALTDKLAAPGVHSVNDILRAKAEAQLSRKATGDLFDTLLDSSDVAPLINAYVRQLIHTGTSSSISSMEELVVDFELFITQHITLTEERAGAFEQRFITLLTNQGVMRLTPLSFRSARRMLTNQVLDDLLELVVNLNAERIQLEGDIRDLQSVFHDPEGRIVHAHDRVHAIANRISVIYSPAYALRHSDLDEMTVRIYLQAIQTAITQYAMLDHTTQFMDPIETFRKIDPRVKTTTRGDVPRFRDPATHPRLIVRTLGHLVRNAFGAGAQNVTIMAECLPADPIYTIAIQDDGPGIAPEKYQMLVEGRGGSGWNILRTVILPKLGAHYKIVSPHQKDPNTGEEWGTLVLLHIPVIARTGDGPDSGTFRRSDARPRPAISDVTPPSGLPVVKRTSSFDGVEPAIASAHTCFGRPPAVILKFPKLR